MIRSTKAICSTVLIAGLLFGCSISTGKITTPADNSSNPSMSTNTPSTITLMMSNPNNPITDKAYDKLKKVFEDSHPGVTLNIVRNIPYVNYRKTVENRFTQGNLPDVYQVYPPMSNDFYKAGMLADLNPFIKSDNLSPESFYKNLNEQSSIDGKLLWLATSSIPVEMIYSKKWFDKANLPYPKDGWTWEEVIDTSKKLYAANGNGTKDKYGLIIPNFLIYLEPIVMSKGGSFLSPDGSKASGYLDGKVTVETFEWIHNLYHGDKISPEINGVASLESIKMIDKQAGMIVQSHDIISGFINGDPSLKQDIGVIGLPKFKDGVRVNSTIMVGYGISAKSQNSKLAWELLRQLGLDKNEASVELFNLGVNSSKIIAQDYKNDPFAAVKANELNYVKKNADQSNKNWAAVVIGGYRARLEKLLAAENIDMQTELTNIAKELDVKLSQ